MTDRKKLLVLIGLLILWGGVIVLELGDESLETGITALQPNQESDSRSPAVQTRAAPTLAALTPLENPKGRVSLTKPRNIFAPLTWDPPRAEPSTQTRATTARKKATPHIPRTGQPPARPAGPSPSELAVKRARQQLMQYRFLGYLTRKGESQAFLTNGQAIYIVRQGELVDGRIQVRRIDPTAVILSMTVRETGDQVEASIPLTEDRSG